MAKKLVHQYTFTPSTNTVVIDHVYKPERLLLITNVTTNQTIFQFNSTTLGTSSVSYDYDAETTTLVLQYDCSAMSSTDKLQIFVEEDYQNFAPSETYVDPVSKIRVSQPENLIDTDFEYGLQTTKWETLELVKNIPTFFARSGDATYNVNDISVVENSDSVLVELDEAHNLLPGAPVIVIGTTVISCDGTFVVTSIPTTNSFRYKSKAIQTFTGSIFDSISTTVAPGSRYQGTEFTLETIDTIITDANAASKLTVTTEFPTNFEVGTSFYLTNSVGPATFFADSSQVSPGISIEANVTTTNATTTGEVGFAIGATQPYDYTARSGVVYFVPSAVNVSSEEITFPYAHGLTDNKWYLYVVGEGNSAIGGLTNYAKYVVRVVDDTTIYLTTAINGTTRVNLTSTGSYGGLMRSAFLRGVQVTGADNRRSAYRWVNFGEDVTPLLGVGAPDRNIPVFFFESGGGLGVSTQLFSPIIYYPVNYASVSAVRFSTTPTGGVVGTGRGGYNGIMVPATLLSDKSSMYFENHGLKDGDTVSFTTIAGTAPTGITSGTFYGIQKVNDNRVQFLDTTTGSQVEFTSAGTTDGVYNLQGSIANPNNDTIFVPEHNIPDGTPVTYQNNGNVTIGGLTSGNTYYTFNSSTNRFRLATTALGWSGEGITFNQSTTNINLTTDVIVLPSAHGFSTGDIVMYTSDTPISGLSSGSFYYVRAQTALNISLHFSAAGASANTDRVNIYGTLSGTGIVRKADIVDITSSSNGTQTFTATIAGASDGVYTLSNSISSRSFDLVSNSQVGFREFAIDPFKQLSFKDNAIRINNHYLTPGTSITYSTTGDPIGGLTSDTEYYVIRLSPQWIRLADSTANAITNQPITLTSVGSGTHSLTTATVAGAVIGAGNVSMTANSTIVTGQDTKFNAVFVRGDQFTLLKDEAALDVEVSAIVTANSVITTRSSHNMTTGDPVKVTFASAPGGIQDDYFYYARTLAATSLTLHRTYEDAQNNTTLVNITSTGSGANLVHYANVGNSYTSSIVSISSPTELILEDDFGDLDTLKYALSTGLFVRADGFALHRPYDGGVELIPSSNPDSTMIRQTRKYFRYQSGKGIQVSFAVNFSPTTQVDEMRWSNVGGTILATVDTRYPHRLTPDLEVTFSGATVSSGNNYWNGSKTVASVPNDYSFTVELDGEPSDSYAQGLVEYYVDNWQNSLLKCGLFDDQNGLYFEYDGQNIHCCRRSSTVQLSGTVTATFKSGTIVGNKTKFLSQVTEGDYVVIKGQSYRITEITSDTLMYILPSYRGLSASNIIVTKTIDTKVPQSQWNIDPCDGTGPTGYFFDIHKIQMAYMDYSWYGAGKVRFGFKDQQGHVKYVHEFIHNNQFTEAYMRSGNIPARYEIENNGIPTYVPALAHWGTSVIMDGRFDDDKAYVFTASSKNLSLVGSGVNTVDIDATIETLQRYYIFQDGRYREANYGLLVATPKSAFNTLTQGLEITGQDLSSGTQLDVPNDSRLSSVVYQPGVLSRVGFSNNSLSTASRTLALIDRAPNAANSTVGTFSVVLGTSSTPTNITYEQPLISIRLAPSVDNGAPGSLGSREIINRMQLILNQVGILTTHAAEITLRLNGALNDNDWQRVTNPSLSQLIYHDTTSRIEGGTIIYSFRAQGGTGASDRSGVLTTQELGDLATLGNSIMGGDNVFPDGPDVLTVTARLVEDVSTVSTTNPFSITGRISWSESQA